MLRERYREILRKELKQTDAAMKRQALQKLKEFEDAKKNGVSDLETAMRRKRNSRRYRPTYRLLDRVPSHRRDATEYRRRRPSSGRTATRRTTCRT